MIKKKLIAAVTCLTIAGSLIAGCGSSAESSAASSAAPAAEESKTEESASPESAAEETAAETAFPLDSMTFLCPSDAGGAMDSNTRFLAPYLEKHLGAKVDVINMGGSACWVGWKYLHDSERDGSIISYANFPNMITGYLDPGNLVGLDNTNFEFLALYTSDYNVIMANKNEDRYTNAAEFFEYAKNNTVTVADAGARTDDAVAVALLEKELGYKFQHVHYQNSAEGFAALMGGHVDALVGNVSEAVQKGDEVLTLAILAEERDANLPDVQTTYEVGVNCKNSSSRGIIAAEGIDPTAKAAIIEACKAAMEDPEQLENAAAQSIAVTPLYGEDFEKWILEQNENISAIFDLLD